MQQATKDQGKNQQGPMTVEEIARLGAQEMLARALHAEIETYRLQYADVRTPAGAPAVVRNGYHRPRRVLSSTGPLEVTVPRMRTRMEGIAPFESALIPKYLRKTLTVDDALPLFYLGGLSNGDFLPCFQKLFGSEATGLSPATITRLKQTWSAELLAWQQRDLHASRYCYWWVDGIYFNLRLEGDRLCILVIIGASEDGRKELVAVAGGYRESAESWRTLLRELRDRGLACPRLCVGDGALGFWTAAEEIYPPALHQRCWVHKTANILDKMPKSAQPQAKRLLHAMYQAETEQQARTSYRAFINRYQAPYPKAVACLTKDEDLLFTFYQFPAEHWQHIRTTNVIESTFATVRLRTRKTRGHGTLTTTLAMVFKLTERAASRWRRLRGFKLLPLVNNGVKCKDGKLETYAA